MKSPLKLKIVTNAVMGLLVLSVGALCLSPLGEEVPAEGKNNEIYRRANGEGVGVSLTFNVYSGAEEVYRILTTLKEYEATATFFIGGCWADDNVQCLRDIYAAGHEIGNHGYFHKDHAKLSVKANEQEISTCNRFIESSIGKAPTLFAPPSGAYGEEMLSVCRELGLKTVLWSKDTIDWRDKDEKVIFKRATEGVSVGDFVLMHPTQATANVLADILQYYQTNGLETVTVSQNLQNEG